MSRPTEQTPRRAPRCASRVLLSACLLFGLSVCSEDDEEPAGPETVAPAEKQEEREKHEREKQDREKQDREKPDREKPDREKPDREKPDREKPDREKPDREKPDREKPDREKPDREKPDREKPDREKPDREKPDREKPDREKPDREKPDREKPDREKPDREKIEREKQAKIPRFSIGGQVSGLASGRNITLRTASGEELPVNVNGAFHFTKLLISGEAYQVEISRQPLWQFCEVQEGHGQAMSSISSVKVLCSDAVAEVTTLAGSGKAAFADGQRLAASFNDPGHVTIDVHGNVYVADYRNHRIRKITPEGKVSTLAGSDVGGVADGQGADASFGSPLGVAVDHQGHVYVADSTNHRIRKITPEGKVSTLAGSDVGGFADGQGADASFESPLGVAVDHQGHVYVADNRNHRIRKIRPTGEVTTLAGSGKAAFVDGMGVQSSFRNPTGVAVDHQGHMYVADRRNHRIRKITPTGEVTTLAGSGSAAFVDGMGVQSSFSSPTGVAVDHQGHVYVADSRNHRIRKITPAGEVTTLAGSEKSGDVDGQGAMASFNAPYGVAVDQEGNVYVADGSNHRIRKISPRRAR
ncbi:hypothetical protein ACNI65_10830 [Roseateles sp. So40a]|uniref:hypothetical protein n=1 Tax=Roseateles sp. So40a TaxID=3400226 RepID=UPI003A8784B9